MIVRGLRGILKALTGIDKTPDTLEVERYNTCMLCPHRKLKRCQLCGCIVELKAKVLSEECPDGRWMG